MNYQELTWIRQNNISLKLLSKESMPFIISFFITAFRDTNRHTISADEIVRDLSDFIYSFKTNSELYIPQSEPASYLNQWADEGFLRKYYTEQSDMPVFELTPSSITVIDFILSLTKRDFIGTESRLLKIFDILREIVYKTDTNPEKRLHELENERSRIDREITAIKAGTIETLDSTQIRERYFELTDTANKLLSDFRQIEYNFRDIDREIRKEIASEYTGKGQVVDSFFRMQDAIRESDQGKTFRGFWEMLLSESRMEELSTLLRELNSIEEIRRMKKDTLIDRLQYNLSESGDKVNRTISLLIEQLTRFLNSSSVIQSKKIIEGIRKIESLAIKLKDTNISSIKNFAEILDKPLVNSIMTRPFHTPEKNVNINSDIIIEDTGELSSDFIYEQIHVNRYELLQNIEKALSEKDPASLSDIVNMFPITKGISEIVGYFTIADTYEYTILDAKQREIIAVFRETDGASGTVSVPLLLFTGKNQGGS